MASVLMLVCLLPLGAMMHAVNPLSTPDNPVPLRILPVGDSITQGGKLDRPEWTYRYPLQQMLHACGVAYDFVGTRQDGLQPVSWPEVADGTPFDPDHAGYYGAKTRRVVEHVMRDWDKLAATPDVVLIHLGTNDQKNAPYDQTVQQPLEAFIGFLRQKNPRVVIALGHLNFNDSEGANAIRPLVEDLARRTSTPASPVITVHHYLGWNERPRQPDSDTFDWAHPNPSGQTKMAKAWLAALAEHVPALAEHD